MQIRYSLNRLDLVRVNTRSTLHNRMLILVWAGISLFFSLNAFNDSSGRTDSLGVAALAVFILFAAIFTLMFAATMLLNALLVACRKHTGVLGEHTLRVTDEGLVETTDHNESLHRWSAYHRTIKTGAYLFLYVNEGMAHVVPLRRPLIEGDLAAFEAALRARTAK